MAMVGDKLKSYTIRWVKFPESGIIMCSCGYGTPFQFLLVSPHHRVKCKDCGKEWPVDYVRFRHYNKQW